MKMITLQIDGREVSVEPGATILDAARKLGIDIPTLCHLDGQPPFGSCMACAVKVNGADRFVPSCATKAADGMMVESETDEVHAERRAAIELLLGDHLGDCVAPCEMACPAHMAIPKMIRQIESGRIREAAAIVKQHIALPAVLGRICSAPCEKACRRAGVDEPVSICLLKRFAADEDLAGETWQPQCARPSGRSVAIIGAGPAGLAAAYHLLQRGHACTLFDAHEQAGGALRYSIDAARLPREVLDAEIGLIEKLGAVFRLGVSVGEKPSLDDLRREFDAVVAASGADGAGIAAAVGPVDRQTLAAGASGVFAAGAAAGKMNQAVRAVAHGRMVAASVDQYLGGSEVTGQSRPFSVHMGKLSEAELAQFAADASEAGRTIPAGGPHTNFTYEEARAEAARCLRCDCRKRDNCALRDWAQTCGADASRFRLERREYERQDCHAEVIYEPGKCIKCGICTRITQQAGEELGLTFVGRGFSVRVAVPLGAELSEGLRKAAAECVRMCPTGALAFKDKVLVQQDESAETSR